jgi:hypothetical protein
LCDPAREIQREKVSKLLAGFLNPQKKKKKKKGKKKWRPGMAVMQSPEVRPEAVSTPAAAVAEVLPEDSSRPLWS